MAAEQIQALVGDRDLPWFGQRTVVVTDGHYSQASFLEPLAVLPDLTSITRLRKDRVLFRQPPAPAPGKSGRRRIYRPRIRPGTLESLPLADEVCEVQVQFGGGLRRVTLYGWNDLILKGESGGHVVTHTVDVVVATVYGDDGRPCYRENLSLVLVGSGTHSP